MPMLAVGAAVLAAVVWVVPLPILTPPPPPPTPPIPIPSQPTASQAQGSEMVTEQWGVLAEGLEALREKAPEAPQLDVAADHVKPDHQPPEVKAPSGLPPLGWAFKGTIDGPGSKAALVTFADGRSRFVFVGQRVPDINNPSGKPAVIREIEHDHILVDRSGTEERIALTRTELANPLRGRISALGNPR
jgi:hypothetical protein